MICNSCLDKGHYWWADDDEEIDLNKMDKSEFQGLLKSIIEEEIRK